MALEKALQALGREGLEDSTDPETLGLAGAVHKRLWEINGNVQELTWSLGYYERTRDASASRSDLEKWAYGSVNAAFVLDLLAAEEGFEARNNGRIYLSSRDAAEATGFDKKTVARGFRELSHYGFIVMTEPGCLGVEGRGTPARKRVWVP